MNNRLAKSPMKDSMSQSDRISLRESSILDSNNRLNRSKNRSDSGSNQYSKKQTSQLKLSTNDGLNNVFDEKVSSGLMSHTSSNHISSQMGKNKASSPGYSNKNMNQKQQALNNRPMSSNQLFGRNQARPISSQSSRKAPSTQRQQQLQYDQKLKVYSYDEKNPLTMSKLSDVGGSHSQKALKKSINNSKINSSQYDSRSQISSVYKSATQLHRSYIPPEEQEIINELNFKLEKIREENKQLEAQMEFICDNENQMHLESSINSLQKQLDEETAHLKIMQKQVDNQQKGIFQYSTINGMDLEVELKNQLAIAMEKSKMADDEYTNLQQYLQMVSEAEKALLKYIPSYYHLLIKNDTMTSQFETTLSKMQANFKRMRVRCGLMPGQRQKASESAETHKERRDELAQSIAEIKQDIEVERHRHIQACNTAAQEKKQIEQDIIELAFNYKQLLKMLDDAMKGLKENSNLSLSDD